MKNTESIRALEDSVVALEHLQLQGEEQQIAIRMTGYHRSRLANILVSKNEEPHMQHAFWIFELLCAERIEEAMQTLKEHIKLLSHFPKREFFIQYLLELGYPKEAYEIFRLSEARHMDDESHQLKVLLPLFKSLHDDGAYDLSLLCLEQGLQYATKESYHVEHVGKFFYAALPRLRREYFACFQKFPLKSRSEEPSLGESFFYAMILGMSLTGFGPDTMEDLGASFSKEARVKERFDHVNGAYISSDLVVPRGKRENDLQVCQNFSDAKRLSVRQVLQVHSAFQHIAGMDHPETPVLFCSIKERIEDLLSGDVVPYKKKRTVADARYMIVRAYTSYLLRQGNLREVAETAFAYKKDLQFSFYTSSRNYLLDIVGHMARVLYLEPEVIEAQGKGMAPFFAGIYGADLPKDAAVRYTTQHAWGAFTHTQRSEKAPEEKETPAQKQKKFLKNLSLRGMSLQDSLGYAERFLPVEDVDAVLWQFHHRVEKNLHKETLDHVRVLYALVKRGGRSGLTRLQKYICDDATPIKVQNLLVTKLFADDIWPRTLGNVLLKEREAGKTEAFHRMALKIMLEDFHQIPSEGLYTMLCEGVEDENGLKVRAAELISRAEHYLQLSRKEVTLRTTDENFVREYASLASMPIQYASVLRYSPEAFAAYMKEFSALQQSSDVMNEFQKLLQAAEVPQAQEIISSLLAGRMPTTSGRRSFDFTGVEDFRAEAETLQESIRDLFGVQCKNLFVAKKQGKLPETLVETIEYRGGTGSLQEDEQYKLYGAIEDEQGLLRLLTDVRQRLASMYKQDKQKRAWLQGAEPGEVLKRYLLEKKKIPDSNAAGEWATHINGVLLQCKEVRERQSEASANLEAKEYTLGMVDKEEEFLRAVRCTDAVMCCFSSKNLGSYAPQWGSRLNADPLSFIMDISPKENRSRKEGFIFGRLGVHPDTHRPVVMLNGVYAANKSPQVVNALLRIIEEEFARKMGASHIVIASKHGGFINPPEGYQYKAMELLAMRALSDKRGKPEQKLYDDIGTVANGSFDFTGYVKELS